MASIPEDAIPPPPMAAAPARTLRRTVCRHTLPLRIMHWINAICLLVLLGSGLQIFNAHPALYWGQRSNFERPWLHLGAVRAPDGKLHGVTTLGSRRFDTTGVLGLSKLDGRPTVRGFPAWATIPGPQWLAMGRAWHFFFAWLFVINGALFVAYALWTRHLARDLVPTRGDWRGIGRSIRDHALLRHPRGEEAARYNVLQRIAYLVVIFGFGGGVVLMGLAMSPRMDSVLGWLVDAVGGRQSARSIHFLIAMGFVAFFLVHIFEVIVTGLGNNLRSIITGRYAIEEDPGQPAAPADPLVAAPRADLVREEAAEPPHGGRS
ncbi:MAG TPA: cytochrome b/b6 domain-containing protein [Rhodanobacteraceae bacterium]|nr:cytochrome b/b6 domain-containing protein [Rhodanobacteraceae bacterium]